ncbi:MAG TPA: (2Fe-2S)-binding protein [Planctomycetota bacterium]|nr:(2Fe-2S)-binding protein [Planctomycetota bacterium]
MSEGLPPPGSFSRCWCTGVKRDEVVRAWTAGARTVEALRSQLGVCGGCGTCRPEVKCLIEELVRAEKAGR